MQNYLGEAAGNDIEEPERKEGLIPAQDGLCIPHGLTELPDYTMMEIGRRRWGDGN